MYFRRVFASSYVARSGRLFFANNVGNAAAATIRNCSSLGLESNPHRIISVAKLLVGPASSFRGPAFPEFRPAYIHSSTEATTAASSSTISNVEGAGEGAMVTAGDEEDSEGTESGRVSRDSALCDGPPDEEGESIKTAHVADTGDICRAPKIGQGKFKEYGNVYDKHEPTMFGDWSHMGRVTDF